MPKIGDRHFAYTPEGMAAAERYKQSIGMNAGGMLGFRPLGYADGALVEGDDADEFVYPDAAARQAAIDYILSTMGSTSDGMVGTLLAMTHPELRRAQLKVMADAEAGKYDSVPRQDISYTYPDILNTPLEELFPRVQPRSIEPSMQPTQPKPSMPRMQPMPSMQQPQQGFNKRDIIPEFRGPNMGRLPDLQKNLPQRPQMPNMQPLNRRMLEQLRGLEKPTPRPGIEPEGGYFIKDGGYVGRGMKNGGIMSLRRY